MSHSFNSPRRSNFSSKYESSNNGISPFIKVNFLDYSTKTPISPTKLDYSLLPNRLESNKNDFSCYDDENYMKKKYSHAMFDSNSSYKTNSNSTTTSSYPETNYDDFKSSEKPKEYGNYYTEKSYPPSPSVSTSKLATAKGSYSPSNYYNSMKQSAVDSYEKSSYKSALIPPSPAKSIYEAPAAAHSRRFDDLKSFTQSPLPSKEKIEATITKIAIEESLSKHEIVNLIRETINDSLTEIKNDIQNFHVELIKQSLLQQVYHFIFTFLLTNL